MSASNLKPIVTGSILTAVLAILAAAAGLFWPGLYEPFMSTTSKLIGGYAQDVFTLLVAVLLITASRLALRGEARWLMVMAGSLLYVIYAYLLWAFEDIYTLFYPLYIIIGSLALFTLLGLLLRLDIDSFRQRVDAGFPVRTTAVVIALPTLMAFPWSAFMLGGINSGTPPPLSTVLVLDLGLVIPLSLLAARLLWLRRSWGFFLAGGLLVKMITMTGSLLLSTVWSLVRGGTIDPVWPLYATMTVLGSVMLLQVWRHTGQQSWTIEQVRLAQQ